MCRTRAPPGPSSRRMGIGAEFAERLLQFGMGPGVGVKVDPLDGRLPGLLHGAHARRRPARMADDAAAAQIHQVERAAGPPKGLRRLAAPLTRTGYGERAVARLEDRRHHRLERSDE